MLPRADDPQVRARRAGPLVVAVVSGLAHLLIGFFYLASGLMAPGWAVVLLLLWWAALAWFGWRLARSGSWLTPVVPVVAVGSWLVVMTAGEVLLGWTP